MNTNETSAAQSHYVKVTSAFAMGGEIVPVGTIAEVSDAEAKNLLHRGKVRLATEEDMASAGVEVRSAPQPAADEPESVDLSKLNKTDLIAHAKAAGVEFNEDDTKAVILAAIAAHQTPAAE